MSGMFYQTNLHSAFTLSFCFCLLSTDFFSFPSSLSLSVFLSFPHIMCYALSPEVSDNLKMQGNIYQDCKDNMNCGFRTSPSECQIMDSLDFLIFIPYFHPIWGSCPLSPGSGLGLEEQSQEGGIFSSSHCSQGLLSPNPQEHKGLCFGCSLFSFSPKVLSGLGRWLCTKTGCSLLGPAQCCSLSSFTLPKTLGSVE